MATSGTTAFSPDGVDIIEKAYTRAGVEGRSGYDMSSARASLDLMGLEWQNRGINLWTVADTTQALTAGTASYTLGTDIIDLMEHKLRQGSGIAQTDQSVTRVSVTTYAGRTNKNILGTPTEIYVDRQRAAPVITLWPVPSSSSMTLAYWYLRRIEDTGGYTNNADVPDRFLPALIAGLAYYIAIEKPSLQSRVPALKAIYDEQFAFAAEEDRDKASFHVVPLVDYTL